MLHENSSCLYSSGREHFLYESFHGPLSELTLIKSQQLQMHAGKHGLNYKGSTTHSHNAEEKRLKP